MCNSPIKVGILGAGNIAKSMLKALNELEKSNIAVPYAIASRDIEKSIQYAKEWNVEKAYGSYEELICDEETDLIYIATPHAFHYEQAKMCIEHKKNVLVEKAFTANAWQAEQLINLAESNNVFITEAMWTRYMPSRIIINEIIQSGEVGEIKEINACFSVRNADKPRMNRRDLCGGALLDLGIYALTTACMYSDSDIDSIESSCEQYKTGVDATDDIKIVYKNGIVARLHTSMIEDKSNYAEIIGSKGYIRWKSNNNPRNIEVYNNISDTIRTVSIPTQINGYEYEIIACRQAICDKRMECEEMPHAETIRVMRIMDELRKDWGVEYPMDTMPEAISCTAADRISISKQYTHIGTYEEYDVKNVSWHEGMVAGNGRIGVIESCAPDEDSLIYQNVEFVMPSWEPRHVPEEVTGQLEEARQAVIHLDDTWNIHGRKRTNMYCYHPGHQLRITMPDIKEASDYVRYTDMMNETINTKFKADGRQITRQTSVLENENVIVTRITADIIPETFIKIDDFEGMPKFGKEKNGPAPELHMKYTRFVNNGCIGVIAHYPEYEASELKNGGFAGVTRILTDGGNIETIWQSVNHRACSCIDEKEPVIRVTGAGNIYIITSLDWTDNMGSMEHFCTYGADIDKCSIAVQCIDRINRNIRDILKAADGKKQADNIQYGNLKTNEELLRQQKLSDDIIPELLWRLYDNGLYGMRACAGYTAPRLSGLWTGEWNLLWRSSYTMDANVNIQVSGMNSSGMYKAGEGYMWFILRQIPDWEINAEKVYGMKDAVLVPVNTDGHRAMMVEYDNNYPFQYWNAGAAWMLIPVHEFLQTYGDMIITTNDRYITDMYGKNTFDIRKDIYNMLLGKTYNFWKQIADARYFTDINGNACFEADKKHLSAGEKYLIIPAFSPENKPLGYKSAITANTAMDISAAKDVINMYIDMLNDMSGGEDADNNINDRISEAQKLMEELPDFTYDESGALREWSMKEYKENNAHRHISHMYCAWPAMQTQKDQKLATVCRQAILNRNRENQGKDDTASHGWIHKALVEARLKNADEVYNILNLLVHSDIFYTTLLTDHNTDRSKGVYCTDTAFGLVGIINEMVMYSDETTLELMPAYSPKLGNGSITGLMSRCGIRIEKLEWNYNDMSIKAVLCALRDTDVKLICRQFGIEQMCHMKSGEKVLFFENCDIIII